MLGYLEKDPSQSTGFKMPVINSKDKWRKFCWDGFVCCLLTGGPAVDALMASRSKYMDSSFAKRMGLGLSSVLEVNEGEFKKLVSDAFRRFDEDGSGTLELPEIWRRSRRSRWSPSRRLTWRRNSRSLTRTTAARSTSTSSLRSCASSARSAPWKSSRRFPRRSSSSS